MNHAVAAMASTTRMPALRVSSHAATFLVTQHGAGAMTEAVRHGMEAKRRGDDPGAEFWCSVCSALVRMQQLGTPLHA